MTDEQIEEIEGKLKDLIRAQVEVDQLIAETREALKEAKAFREYERGSED